MLTKLPIGQPEPREKLKCENCGMSYNDRLTKIEEILNRIDNFVYQIYNKLI